MEGDKRRAVIALIAGVCLFAVAIPVLAVSPSASEPPTTASPQASGSPDLSTEASTAPATTSPSPTAVPATIAPATVAPEATATPVRPDATAEPDRTLKPDKGPETTISLTGIVNKAVDGKGRPAYTMTVAGATWELSAGPPWYWGDKNPLNAFVGKSVTVAGTTHTGDTEIDVETVDGTLLRAPGKPPWAGGPWVVGSSHPGWKGWMANGKPGNGLGRETAPGQLKKTPPAS